MSWAGAIYRAVGTAAVASGLPRWTLRDRPDELAERLGGVPRCTKTIWIHAASVGELAAAAALLRQLREEAIQPVALSVMTRTGLRAAADLPLDHPPFHPPLDAPGPVGRALDRLRPAAWITLETELWPTLVRTMAERGVPAAVASARLSERGHARMRRARALYRPVVGALSAVAARSETDAERFVDLGARRERIRVTGDLKEDHPVPERVPPPVAPRWIAACTRPGEEEDILAAVDRLRERVPRGELLLAPRHPERFDEVARLVERAGLPLRRWSRLLPPSEADGDDLGLPPVPGKGPGWSVLLIDEMGVLDRAYRESVCAFVGGSLRPFHGHSPLEAARAGRPVVMGPDTANCEESFARLESAGAALRVDGPAQLALRISEWLTDPSLADRAGLAAHAVASSGAGAARRTVAFLREQGVLP